MEEVVGSIPTRSTNILINKINNLQKARWICVSFVQTLRYELARSTHMRGRSEGLYLWTRHSDDCKYVNIAGDRDQSRRCNCMKYIAGSAPDGTLMRESTGTTSWDKARKILARKLAEHDPVNKRITRACSTGSSFPGATNRVYST